MKRFLVKHIGNMGDMVFFVPPVLETLKKRYPNCHITFVTTWGFKQEVRPWGLPWLPRQTRWGKRSQSGFCIELMMTNPHIDQLVHWHDTKTSLSADICIEDGRSFPTWSREYYETQKESGRYDAVYELDFGIGMEDNPLQKMYEHIGLADETYTNYKIYLAESDKEVARSVMESFPKPRIVLLEGLEGTTTRGWDPDKIPALEEAIQSRFGVDPIWFGGKYERFFEGRGLTLRENIATLMYCDVAIGVLSGPLHFAAAIGIPTITLYGDHPMHRAAPAYFLNPYISDSAKKHRTLLGPTGSVIRLLKDDAPFVSQTPQEAATQGYSSWQHPGRQSTKSCIAVITVDEVIAVVQDMLSPSL